MTPSSSSFTSTSRASRVGGIRTPEAAAAPGRDSLYDTWHIAQTITGGPNLRTAARAAAPSRHPNDPASSAGPLILQRFTFLAPVGMGECA